MKRQYRIKRTMIASLLQEYPDSSFALGREATVDALTTLLADYSAWAIGNAVDAFLEGRSNGLADPTWFPSAPVLCRLIERIDEAKDALEGTRLEHTLARLKQRAIEAMPTHEDIRRNAESWRAATQGKHA